MNVRRILLLVAFEVSFCLVALAQDSARSLLEDAKGQASNEKRLILLEFFSHNSVESRLLRERTMDSAEVRATISDGFVSVRVEVEREDNLRRMFSIVETPTVVLTRPDGSEIDRLVGVVSPQNFLAFMKAASGGTVELDLLREKAAAPASPPEAVFAYGEGLYRRKRINDAVETFGKALDLVFSDSQTHGKHARPILNRIASISRYDSSAVDPIRKRRDKMELDVRNAPNSLTPLLFELNSALNDNDRNIALYLALPTRSPWKERVFGHVFLELVEKRKYAEAVGAVDLEVYVTSVYPKKGLDTAAKGESDEKAPPAAFFKTMQNRVTENSAAAVEALLATGQFSMARRIAERAIEKYDSVTLRGKFAEGAKQAGGTDADRFVKWLAEIPPPKPGLLEPETSPASKIKTELDRG